MASPEFADLIPLKGSRGHPGGRYRERAVIKSAVPAPSLRWLVVGASGQLGTDLMRALPAGAAIGLSRAQLDVTDAHAVRMAVLTHRPDVLVNAAAYTAVDAAENDEARAAAVNADGAANLARACAEVVGARLVQISTDYVFDGAVSGGAAGRDLPPWAGVPEPYDVDAPTEPRSAYGRTKLAGERAVREILPDRSWVVRTAWLYGADGANFVRTMMRLERDRPTVEVVADQHGSPTFTADLAAALGELGRRAPAAVTLHCTNAGATTWHGLARAVFAAVGADPDRVRPIGSDRLELPAPRPVYAVLSDRSWAAAGLTPLRPWQDAVPAGVAAIRAAHGG